MKTVYFMLAALVISFTSVAQGTPQEKEALRNDVARENHKKAEVVKDVFRGEPAKARADNRAAITYHRRVHSDVHRIHQTDRRIARQHPHHVVVRHHYRHHRHYTHHPRHRTVVVVHH